MSSRNLEQILKFDSGLPVGTSLVLFTCLGKESRALVHIGTRGKVTMLTEPQPEDMYTSWTHVQGDNILIDECKVIVWGINDQNLMSSFDRAPHATVDISHLVKKD